MCRGALFGFKVPELPSQIVNRNDERVRMSQNTNEDDDTNHNYLEEDVDINDLVILSSTIDNLGGPQR